MCNTLIDYQLMQPFTLPSVWSTCFYAVQRIYCSCQTLLDSILEKLCCLAFHIIIIWYSYFRLVWLLWLWTCDTALGWRWTWLNVTHSLAKFVARVLVLFVIIPIFLLLFRMPGLVMCFLFLVNNTFELAK